MCVGAFQIINERGGGKRFTGDALRDFQEVLKKGGNIWSEIGFNETDGQEMNGLVAKATNEAEEFEGRRAHGE